MEGDHPQIAVILHFHVMAAALSDFRPRTGRRGSNSNRELVEELPTKGAGVSVCGRSVVRRGHAVTDVLPGIRFTDSAMIFNISRPADGWTRIGVY